jgi:uncharacterized protein YfaS (alpha-2-macroglobulin family)
VRRTTALLRGARVRGVLWLVALAAAAGAGAALEGGAPAAGALARAAGTLGPRPVSAAETAGPAIVFAPQGTVKGVRQATARFPEAMVALGDPRAPVEPFTVDCPEAGTERWLDTRTWAYDFARDLPAGVRCRFRLRDGLATLAGRALSGGAVFAFSTGGPAVRAVEPYEGRENIAEDQAFVLRLDAEAGEESIGAHVWFAVEGVPERIGARLLAGDERRTVLEAVPYMAEPPVVVVQATQTFPNGARVALVWGAGVATPAGVASEEDQRLEYRVRKAFTVSVHCERARRDAGCMPVTPVTVQFSAPVPWERARGVALAGPGDERRAPAATAPHTELVGSVRFGGPFPERSTLRVELPAGLADDAGRTAVNADRFPLDVRTDELPPLAKFGARFGIVEWNADPTLPVTLRNLEPEARARLLPVTGEVTGGMLRVPAERERDVLPWLRRVGEARRERSLLAGLATGGAAPSPGRGAAGATPSREDTPAGASPARVSPSPPADPSGGGAAAVRTFTLPKPGGERAFEVVGIPLPAPGLWIVELESARLGAALLEAPRPMYVPTAVLATNLSVHLKWGDEGSLAWVTTLDEARPVAGAEVTVRDCEGTALWRGTSDPQGLARIDGLPAAEELPRCWGPDGPPEPDPFDAGQARALRGLYEGLFVTARAGDDLSFVHTSWTEGIEAWRYDLPAEPYQGRFVAHTILDRPLFRAGETVHMKHVFRAQTLRGFGAPPAERRPVRVAVRHAGSDQRYELPLALDAGGVGVSEWPIPREAKLGRYEIHLLGPAPAAETPSPGTAAPAPAGTEAAAPETAAPVLGTAGAGATAPGTPERAAGDDGGEPDWEGEDGPEEWLAGAFRVEEFRVPLMRGVVQLPAEPQVRVAEVAADVAVHYLAGGGAAGLPVTVRAQVEPRRSEPPEELEGFRFANGRAREGMVRPRTEPERAGPAGIHARYPLTLDAAGAARVTIGDLPVADAPLDLRAELELRDPSGRAQTVSSTVPLWPSRWLVGVAPEAWTGARERIAARVGVVDVAGRPVAGARVRVDALARRTYSHRKRVVGGFYAYDHVVETRRLGPLCEAATDARGMPRCEGAAPAEGEVVLEASVADPEGHVAAAHGSLWVAGAGDWWHDVADSDRIDLLPERRRYEPGETARFQVRMPFREATALVTVEREGVLDARVVPLAGAEPVIEVPVEARHAPNTFVSVLVVRGRVGDVQPTALVDLGKPAFKLGIAEIQVGWRAHALAVKVATDREAYRVRETVPVKIAVRAAGGRPAPGGGEVAFAAVDEGLLELLPNASWRLLEAMMGRRGYGVATATAQMQVAGKRHYGLKALPQGGGGGREPTRELFDTLLLWRARVPLDARGRATIEVPLNDSLTSFRLVAVATAGLDRFGTGAATIRATQDLMVLPGLPPLVREGDRFRAEVTVRNTTAEALEARVTARVEELSEALAPAAVRLAPGEAHAVGWEVTVPAGAERLRWEVEAAAGARADRVAATQEVVPAVPARTLHAALVRLEEGGVRVPVERPSGALPDRGEVRVALAPSLAAGLAGVRAHMRRYPYGCLEQRVSRAVALGDPSLWREVAAALPAHLDDDGLLKFFPALPSGSEVLTAYVLAVAPAAGLELPATVRARGLEGLRRFVEGTLDRAPALRTADLAVRKLAALEALSRHGKAEPALVGSLTIEPTLWPTSAVLDWWNVLERVPAMPERSARLGEARAAVRARLTAGATALGFSTERADDLWWLMSNADTNAARLVLTLLEHGVWREELPRLVRGALGRQHRGAWSTTTANAWGALAVEGFAAAFERAPVGGVTTAALAGAAHELGWAGAPAGGVLAFPWPAAPAELALAHAGTGRPWATVETRAAVPLAAPLAAGFRVTRAATPLEARVPGQLSRGDTLRVRLEVEAERDMTWVVVNDPVPAGASHLATGLASDAALAAEGGEPAEGVAPAFVERGFEAFRAYYELVPKGTFAAEYAIRLNHSGRFALPPTRVEALYAPDTFGEIPNAPIEVAP